MVDFLLTIILQHYVLAGIVVIGVGVLVNVAFNAHPHIVESMRHHKLF